MNAVELPKKLRTMEYVALSLSNHFCNFFDKKCDSSFLDSPGDMVHLNCAL